MSQGESLMLLKKNQELFYPPIFTWTNTYKNNLIFVFL